MKKLLKFLTLSFFILTIFLTCGCEEEEEIIPQKIHVENPSLTISFIDVGQGDSILVECDDDAMLIDAGTYSEHLKVKTYLDKRNIESLDYLVATHPHSDHIGGMSEIVYSYDPETLVYPICEENSKLNSVLDACDEKDVSYYNPDVSDTFTLGGATITVLSPAKDEIYSNLNNYSLVLKLEYDEVSFLFTGDAESMVESKLIRSGTDLRADVLKCGHHGSSTSSSHAFLDAVNPTSAVISCAKNNDYGHPHSETVNALIRRNIDIYRTDEMSTVVAVSDGKNIEFLENNSAATRNYTGNKQSRIFHSYDCGALETMKDKNKVYFTSREDAVNEGFSPCKNCNP